MSTKEEDQKIMEENLHSLSKEYDEQIQSLEYDLSWAKSQKHSAEQSVDKMKAREISKDTLIKEMEEDMNKIRIQYNFDRLFLTAKTLSLQNAMLQKEDETISLVNDVENKHEAKEQELRKKIHGLEKQALKYEQRMQLVTATLLNHKRDELLQHKTKSRAVATKIKDATDEINMVHRRREELLTVLSHMEDEMKNVERRLQEHSQVSALQGGKININHARKKRRLDEE